jgi:hypothetical protein
MRSRRPAVCAGLLTWQGFSARLIEAGLSLARRAGPARGCPVLTSAGWPDGIGGDNTQSWEIEMKRLVPLGLASLASLALMAPGAATAADVALVIGNYDYREAPDALSARADARAVAEALEERGYEVTSGTDLDRREMRQRIAEFAGRVLLRPHAQERRRHLSGASRPGQWLAG